MLTNSVFYTQESRYNDEVDFNLSTINKSRMIPRKPVFKFLISFQLLIFVNISDILQIKNQK